MRGPAIEIVEFREFIYGEVEGFITLRDQLRISKLLSRVNRRDSQISRQMVVVDVADRMLRVVIEVQSLLEQGGRGWHVLRKDLLVRRLQRVGIPCHLPDMPEMSSAQQCVERWVVGIGVDRRFQFLLYFRDSRVVVPVVNRPELLNRSTADPRALTVLLRDGHSAVLTGAVAHGNETEKTDNYQRPRD